MNSQYVTRGVLTFVLMFFTFFAALRRWDTQMVVLFATAALWTDPEGRDWK